MPDDQLPDLMDTGGKSGNFMRLLLCSSSRVHGSEFLEHCADAIKSHFEHCQNVLFVPYALADHDSYEATVKQMFNGIGLQLTSIHRASNPVAAVDQANGMFIGGGNSFRLLKALYDLQLVHPIARRVAGGMLYMGSSAGTNMACPTIRTTNDMPIVQPPSFNALHLIPFQINPHYLDADPHSTHKGETRAQRLQEFLEENDVPVAALREGSWLEVVGNRCILKGKTGMVLFARGQQPEEKNENDDLSFLLQVQPSFV